VDRFQARCYENLVSVMKLYNFIHQIRLGSTESFQDGQDIIIIIIIIIIIGFDGQDMFGIVN
jgi:hypothetical protein